MKAMLLLLMTIVFYMAKAQYTVKIELTSIPRLPVTETIYISGNFNGWNPRDENNKLLLAENGRYYLSLPGIKAGMYEWKFTRGNWNNVETDLEGKDIPNRVFSIGSDTTLSCSVAAWKDQFAGTHKRKSTASPRVKIMDSSFAIPQLNTSRRIWIYFPKDYLSSDKSYPVLYMHDGQNLFDDATSFAGEWGIDETLDSINASCIVIGIDNGGIKRMNEYNPNDHQRFGKGEGKEYLEFIVKKLKPYVDKRYRTLPGKATTFIAGSSMGGLISFYAGLYYPEVFGAMGIFSPSFELVADFEKQLAGFSRKSAYKKQRYYFYAGAKESYNMVTYTKKGHNSLQQHLEAPVDIRINEEGLHNEACWRKEFPLFFDWLIKK
jgi:predicted alpha/beta superfamily hydrolase